MGVQCILICTKASDFLISSTAAGYSTGGFVEEKGVLE